MLKFNIFLIIKGGLVGAFNYLNRNCGDKMSMLNCENARFLLRADFSVMKSTHNKNNYQKVHQHPKISLIFA